MRPVAFYFVLQLLILYLFAYVKMSTGQFQNDLSFQCGTYGNFSFVGALPNLFFLEGKYFLFLVKENSRISYSILS